MSAKFPTRARLLMTAAIITSIFCGAYPQGGQCFVSKDLAAVKKTDFFQFFHFSQESAKNMPDKAQQLFFVPPSTSAFGGLAVVEFTTKPASETVHSAVLLVSRDFVDSPGAGLFAADIVKSFINETNAKKDPILTEASSIIEKGATDTSSSEEVKDILAIYKGGKGEKTITSGGHTFTFRNLPKPPFEGTSLGTTPPPNDMSKMFKIDRKPGSPYLEVVVEPAKK